MQTTTNAANTDFPIAIIGAGFAGIGMAIQLKKAGIGSFTMFERAGEIGGTWRDNTYPGAACDVPSHVYSFSFEQKSDWSRAFAESSEIQAYLLGVVDKWRLRPHMRFNTEIVEARFDEGRGLWTLTTDHGEQFTARVVISGVGGLVDPATPQINGLENFRGAQFHTARWNHQYDLRDKRVAVIGTGASAVQVVPSIAPIVGTLSVFQRTAAWVMPKHDKQYADSTKRFLGRHRAVLNLSRLLKYWVSEAFGPMVFLDSKSLSAIGEKVSLQHLRACVKNPELRAKLTPTFQFGCKRVLISDDYWPAFERPNVELITEAIDEVLSDRIRTTDGVEHRVDAIILATGFKLGLTKAPFPVIGRGAKTLDDAWKGGAVAYKGMTISGFPNWFILMGPNTGPGHTSVLVYTEAQIAYAVQAIKKLIGEKLKFVDVKQEVQDRYNDGLQRRMKYMSWSSGCHSWYLSPDGSNHALFPGFASEYVVRARKFKASEYEIVKA
ncbi:MAG: NAD(P)/FAD-dependent oxidoreductase [Deltaproteobacteria bacterium]|nr:NAD(P)/FAD-dependent oxidoreductase [Deltaproteobacteria bacterium]